MKQKVLYVFTADGRKKRPQRLPKLAIKMVHSSNSTVATKAKMAEFLIILAHHDQVE